jgi:GNAT superfamily N-acetyltransferase
VDGDRLLGNVTYCPPGSPWREIGRDDEGEFRMLAVDPDARGAGAGTALATHCEERAREHGAVGMALSSLAAMTDAHRIYTRLGYTRDPGRDWSPLPGVALVAFSKVW